MPKMSALNKYKSQIFSAVLGALLSGVVSLSVGVFNLAKSFEITQTKERRGTLRSELGLLRKVERELDANLKLLLTQNMQPSVEVEKVETEVPENIAEPNVRAFLVEMMRAFNRDQFRVKSSRVPRQAFLVTAWPFALVPSEISFDLGEDIHGLYMTLSRINSAISTVDFGLRTSGSGLGAAEVERIRDNCDSVRESIKEVSSDRILDLKNRVGAERQRLEKLLQALPQL